jgi:P27 family predicted phage terminase small subunit
VATPRKDIFDHQLQGTVPRYGPGAESHVAGSLPKPPKFLSKEARKKFKQLVKQLSDRRAVTQGDGDLITIYCSTHERWLQALEAIRNEGVVVKYERLGADGCRIEVEKPNLSLKIAEVAERSMVSILTRLGLTPKDREGVRPTSAAKPKNAPPPPESCAGVGLELDRLRAQQAKELEEDAELPQEEEVDFDKLLEAADDQTG